MLEIQTCPLPLSWKKYVDVKRSPNKVKKQTIKKSPIRRNKERRRKNFRRLSLLFRAGLLSLIKVISHSTLKRLLDSSLPLLFSLPC